MPRLPTRTEDASTWHAVASSLTARDRELLAHLLDGRSTAQIAAAMAISTNTVRSRFRRLARKLDTAPAALDGHSRLVGAVAGVAGAPGSRRPPV